MTTTKTLRTAALVGVVSALAVPAVAAAHPTVYPSTAKVAVVPATDPVTYTDQVRYVVANHGFTYVLRESNGQGAGTPSVISYALAAGKSGDAILTSPAALTGAQAHATCDVPQLRTTAVVRSWQADPFYAYVPFQSGSAGLEDDPAKWLPVVRRETGVDLTRIPDTDAAREAACEALPGANASSYVPADATQSTNATFNSGLIAHTKQETAAPFEARITTFEETVAAARAQQAATDAQLAAAVAKLGAPAKPLAATLAKRAFTPAELVAPGVPVTVTGPAGQRVRVRATVRAAQARRLGLRSTVLGSTSGTVGKDGSTRITVKPSSAQGTKLKRAMGSVAVTLELVVGTTTATVSR